MHLSFSDILVPTSEDMSSLTPESSPEYVSEDHWFRCPSSVMRCFPCCLSLIGCVSLPLGWRSAPGLATLSA